jgi:hypothetical protein
MIHWDHIGLGLQKTTGAFVNAKLREESLETIPTHCRQPTALTLSEHTNSIWRQEAIRNAGIDCTFARQQGQTLHSTSMRQTLIPWQSSGQHPTLPKQCHCIPIVKTNHRYNAANTSTPQLSSHTGGCSTLLSRQRYGISSTQQRELLECLAGNVGNMSATCRRRVNLSPIWTRYACQGQHFLAPDTCLTTFCCRGMRT